MMLLLLLYYLFIILYILYYIAYNDVSQFFEFNLLKEINEILRFNKKNPEFFFFAQFYSQSNIR